jgi:predicted O-methyltransferase YrrM
MLKSENAEPTSPEMIADWIAARQSSHDRFLHIYERSETHRIAHGPDCEVYPTGSGPLLGVLAAATGAKRILEVGCGLGYSTMWLLHGAGPSAHIDTCESDASHAALARETFEQEAVTGQIALHEGSALMAIGRLSAAYDLVFLDGNPGEYPKYVDTLLGLMRTGGLLISSNLFLGVHVPDAPYLEAAAEYRDTIVSDERLLTTFLPRGLALSVRR